MAQDNVTIKLVSWVAPIAIAAFIVGGWAGDLRANDVQHERELDQLREIARDFRTMANGMEQRIRALEDWRTSKDGAAPRLPGG